MLPACAAVKPVGQDVQAAAPDDDAYEPAAQRAQAAAPDVGAELPTGQGVQLAAEAPTKPGAQTEHAAALALPMAEPFVKVPEGHAVQLAARLVPMLQLVSTPKKPGAHAVHAMSQALAAFALVVVMPDGQGEHCEAPAAEYEATGQIEGPAACSVPGL